MVVFPDGYLSAFEESATAEKLAQELGRNTDAGVVELIREAKRYSGKNEREIKSLAQALEDAKNLPSEKPPYYKNSEGPHTYRDYEGAFQKGVNRILDETDGRIRNVKETYKRCQAELLQELGRRSTTEDKNGGGEIVTHTITEAEIRKRLEGLEKLMQTVENEAANFNILNAKYSNAFDAKIPTVSCPVDLIEISRNLRILKDKNNLGKTDAQAYLIDQWLQDGKTFLDLRGSPVTVYYMLQHTAETERDAGVRRLLENTCAALEKEFIGGSAHTKYWAAYAGAIKEIIGCWQHWRILRSAADRNSRAFALPSYISPQNIAEQLQSASESEINRIRLSYFDGNEERYLMRQLIENMMVKNSGTSLVALLSNLPSGSELTGIQFFSGLAPVEEYTVNKGRLQRIEPPSPSEYG